jgi:HEPN domain-containing protein
LSTPINSEEIEIHSVEEAEKYIRALEKFFNKIENVLRKWHYFRERYIEPSNRKPTYTYTRRGEGIDAMIEDIFREYASKLLEESLRSTLGRMKGERITEDKVDKIIEEIKKDLNKKQ